MNNPIKLKENIFAVVVPKETIKCEIKNNVANTESLYLKAFKDENVYRFIPIEVKGVFELLGEVTADSISFDVEPYVNQNEFDVETYDGILVASLRFWDYLEESFDLFDKDESFYSLLQSKVIYFVNPIEKPNVNDDYWRDANGFTDEYMDEISRWQEAESKLVEKVIILNRK